MAFIKRRLRNVKARPLVTKEGEKLLKRVVCKVIIGDKMKPYFHKFVAPAGKGYTEDDVYMIRAQVIDHLDHKFPFIEFNEVEVGKDQFNYVACGARGMLHQPELSDGQRTEAEGADSGNAGGSIAEQIAAALNRAGSSEPDHEQQSDGDASTAGTVAGIKREPARWNTGASRGTEDPSVAAESTSEASTPAASTEEHPVRSADGIDLQKDLQG
jgi:hypothetical protein